MLIVDPVKRITIPEIRQHRWFQTHLPRYLAVSPPDTVEQAKKVGFTAIWNLKESHAVIVTTSLLFFRSMRR